jgi:hypothetical protein
MQWAEDIGKKTLIESTFRDDPDAPAKANAIVDFLFGHDLHKGPARTTWRGPSVWRVFQALPQRFPSARIFSITKSMKPPTTVKRKKRGRPATGVDQLYGVRIPDNLILAIDRWTVDNDSSSRSDAIRRLLELGLSFSKKPPKAKH